MNDLIFRTFLLLTFRRVCRNPACYSRSGFFTDIGRGTLRAWDHGMRAV